MRVWNRNGTLHSTSEPTEGLEQVLNWRPSGNLIGISQRKPHRHDVIFFERNGLRHGEFTLRGGRLDWIVRELAWNADSSVLLLWLQSNEDRADLPHTSSMI